MIKIQGFWTTRCVIHNNRIQNSTLCQQHTQTHVFAVYILKNIEISGFSFLNSSGVNLFSLQAQQHRHCGKNTELYQSGIQQKGEKKQVTCTAVTVRLCLHCCWNISLLACQPLPHESESISSSLSLYLNRYRTGKAPAQQSSPYWTLATAARAFTAPQAWMPSLAAEL